jgi:GT2 family glycosyltransferase
MSQIDLSISIVSYNTADYLRQCLTSVLENTEGISCEIIVVDNASTDGSAAMVAEQFPSVRLIKNSENRYFSRAHNQALTVASGRYFLVLNPDTVIPTDTLKRLVYFLESHPSTGAVTCRELTANGEVRENCGTFLTPWIEIVQRTNLQRVFKRAVLNHRMVGGLNERCTVDTITGCFAMIRTGVMRDLGGFDERLLFYYSDNDLSARIWSMSHRVEFIPDVAYVHYGQRSTETMPKGLIAEIWFADMQNYYRKHFGALTACAVALTIRISRRLDHVAKWLSNPWNFRASRNQPRLSSKN